MARAREKQWFTSRNDLTSVASAARDDIQLYNATTVGAREIKGATVLRAILEIELRATAVAQEVGLFWGLVIVNEVARIGNQLPDPRDTADRADWMIRGNLRTIQSSLSDSSQWDRRRYDVRSGRMLRSEEDGVLVVFRATASTFTLEFSSFMRVLMLMP